MTLPDWKYYEGELVNGEFPLERYLGGTETGAVFLTGYGAGNAAIKFKAADAAQAEELVRRWNRAAGLEYRHLASIYAAGSWALAGVPMAYVVTEYAEENLAEVLRDRPLTNNEALEMLLPVADALVYLHARGLAHGDLKPSNILAVGETVKITCEEVAPGDPAADIRAFGTTVVQALGQRGDTGRSGGGDVVDALPFPFGALAKNCLERDPRLRWPADKIAAWLRSPEPPRPRPSPPVVAAPVAPPAARAPRRWQYAAVAGVVGIGAVIVGGVAMRRAGLAPTAGEAVRPIPPAAAPAPPSGPDGKTGSSDRVVEPSRKAAAQDEIVRRVLPNIPAKALNTIRGKATEVVRVTVDAAGKVTGATLERSVSPYFGKLVLEAARKWEFAREEGAGPRSWTLRFELTRTGTQVIPRREGRG